MRLNERPASSLCLAAAAAMVAVCAFGSGCNTILGANQDFVLGDTTTNSGTTSTGATGGGGAMGGTGGTGALGGTGGTGGTAGSGAVGGTGGSAGSGAMGGTGGTGGTGGAPSWTVIETLTVQGDGSDVVSNTVLQNGVTYHLRASGTFNMNTNQNWMADAEYYDFSNPPSSVKDAVSGVDIGIGVDDPTVDANRTPNWGPFDMSHVYEIPFDGSGAAITANYHDAVTYDNEGTLTLEILAWQ
jgi:hypothetical protein